MKIKEIRALNSGELAKQLEEAQKELLDLRFRHTTKQLVNHRQLWMVKKRIARLKTVMREEELGWR